MEGADYVTAEQKVVIDCELSKQRATIHLHGAAQEAVALGQSVGEFLALASVAHAQAMKRAARVGR